MDAFVTRLKSNSRKSSISKTDISVDSLQSKLKSPSFKLKQDLYYNIAKGHEVNPHGKSNNGAASYFKHRSEKLKKQFATNKTSSILDGVVCYINGYTGTKISDHRLKKLIYEHGGTYLPYPNKTVTHLIATSLCGSKLHKIITSSKHRVKVVKPEWILDSISNGKRIPEQDYSIVLNQNQNPIGNFMSQTVNTSQTSYTRQDKAESEGGAATKLSSANISKTDKEKQDNSISEGKIVPSKKSRSNSFFLKLLENENNS